MKIYLSIFILFVISFPIFGQNNKLKADEIVQKHLASIGTPDALAAVKSTIVVGKTKTNFRGLPTTDLVGVAQFGSESDKVLLALIFNEIRYPYEKAGYNGQDFSISRLPTGSRSALGDFLMSHSVIFKEGLIGGSLSSAWPLLNIDLRKPKLEYTGMERVNNRQTHKVRYSPRKNSEGMQIDMYFDAETFRHVRTEYQFTLTARIGGSPTSGIRQTDTIFKLVEDFDDFRTEGNLMLPHTYQIAYTTVQKEQSLRLEWLVNFSTFVFNQPIDAKAYEVSGGK